jgi:hypothetical protein
MSNIIETLDLIVDKSIEIRNIASTMRNNMNDIILLLGLAPVDETHPPKQEKPRYSIIIDEEVHYIEGNKFKIFIRDNNCPISDSGYIKFCGEYDMYSEAAIEYNKITSDMTSFELINRITPDPNFDSQEAADEYMDNRD